MAGQGKTGLPQVLCGCVLWGIAKALEKMGDIAPLATDGISGERLVFHLAALAAMVGAAVLFFWGGRRAFSRLLGRTSDTKRRAAETAQVFAGTPDRVDAPEEFDADAAFARYMARKQTQATDPLAATPPARPARGFGRKQV